MRSKNKNAGGVHMNTDEKRKYLHEIIEKLNESQIERLYQLIRGIFGRAV